MKNGSPDAAASSTGSDLDLARLSGFLAERLDLQGPMAIERISGGQSNPTFFVTFPNRRLVLRKRPSGPTLPSAHAIDREYRIMAALAGTGVPVPPVVLYHAEADVLDTPFYVMDRVEGRVFHDCALPGIEPGERRAIYFSMADTLAALHAVDPASIGLGDFGRPGNYFARQLQRWSRQWADSTGDDIPDLDAVAEYLAANLPPDDGLISIAHGDYRLGNLILHPTEPRVVGILDWELSTLGHPLADLGFCCLPWHTAPDEYAGIAGLDHAALGIPSEAEFVQRYFASAKPVAGFGPFHLVFALFRFAVIFVGIADRARAGNAAGGNAEEIGHLARNFARRALEITTMADHGDN